MSMSQPDDDSQEALRRLDQRLEALKADRAPKRTADGSAERSMGEGYRLVAEVIGGILGGLGLGWLFDRFAHTTPFGMVIGLLLGFAGATYAAVKTATRSATPASPAKDETED